MGKERCGVGISSSCRKEDDEAQIGEGCERQYVPPAKMQYNFMVSLPASGMIKRRQIVQHAPFV